jgi:hypothetical protein
MVLSVLAPIIFVSLNCQSAQKPPQAWTEFVEAGEKKRASALPDFSFAGYAFSEKPIPDVQGRLRFDVTAFGATPDDKTFDDECIQSAINAAESSGGGVVYFPPGKYLISPDRDRSRCLRISHSGIVLRGAGAGVNGAEIHMVERRVGARQFVFRPPSMEQVAVAKIVNDVSRGAFWAEVSDPSALSQGQVVVISHRSAEFTKRYFGSLPLSPEWTRLSGVAGGMVIREIHTIDCIDGNRVCFHNPVQFDLVANMGEEFQLLSYPTIADCGVEEILFTGSWDGYPEEFVHHQDAIHDSGWCALLMQQVQNSWIRNCEFRNWNECICLDGAYATTVEKVTLSGKKGHSSVFARSGYGVLITECQFQAGHHHGPGPGYGAVNTVITKCVMQTDQNIESHSGQPYATLFDDVRGGVLRNMGGPLPGLPHHGKHLVLWNFRHHSTYDFHYNFWDVSQRRNHTIARPLLIGFQANRRVTFENEGLNERPGELVEPRSLFDAQLALRLSRSVASDQASAER